MQTALALEKNVNQSLLDLHKVAEKHNDTQVSTNPLNIDLFFVRIL